MIRLVRGPEPDALRAKRPDKLTAARAVLASGEEIDFTGYGDDGVKEQLFQGQHRKCAYCEHREQESRYHDAEHYRPKSRYWWLAWTWENLLFACLYCNRDHKKNQFPLVDEMRRLIAEVEPPGDEQPLLIDPYDSASDPANEIEFRPERVQGKERWKPYGVTERGRQTVQVCGLDRPSLLTLYEAHVREMVRSKVDQFLRTTEMGRPQEIVKAWKTLVRGLFGKDQPFQQLSRDALTTLIKPELSARYQLTL